MYSYNINISSNERLFRNRVKTSAWRSSRSEVFYRCLLLYCIIIVLRRRDLKFKTVQTQTISGHLIDTVGYNRITVSVCICR